MIGKCFISSVANASFVSWYLVLIRQTTGAGGEKVLLSPSQIITCALLCPISISSLRSLYGKVCIYLEISTSGDPLATYTENPTISFFLKASLIQLIVVGD